MLSSCGSRVKSDQDALELDGRTADPEVMGNACRKILYEFAALRVECLVPAAKIATSIIHKISELMGKGFCPPEFDEYFCLEFAVPKRDSRRVIDAIVEMQGVERISILMWLDPQDYKCPHHATYVPTRAEISSHDTGPNAILNALGFCDSETWPISMLVDRARLSAQRSRCYLNYRADS